MITRRIPRSARARAVLTPLVTAALVAASLPAPRSGPPAGSAASLRLKLQTAAPSGGFALAGGLGGRIDERTGQMSVSVPLTTVGGQGTAAVLVSLSWQQERAAASVDRSGWGAGWSVGSSFVDVAGLKRVYPADGGSYFLDASEPSGLKDYKLRDLTFASKTGILPRRVGAGQVSFSYQLTYDDGRVDYFGVNGNLVARIDRFGNRVDLTWRARANNVWQPTSIIDTFGLATTFDYSTPGQVKVLSPQRSDGVSPTTTIVLSPTQAVQSVTDPVGNKTSFAYSSVSGAPKPLLTLITAATGARSMVSYQSPAYEPGLAVVSTLKLTDAAGNVISPLQSFSLNPPGNNQHNFTGYPNHLGTGGQDALFASGDTIYTYTTSLTTGATTTLSTYDALHRLIRRQISVVPAAGQLPIPAQRSDVTYPTPVRIPALLPANYAHPTQVAVAESSATSAAGLTASAPRTTTSSTSYDDHGRVVSATDEVGTTTTTEYDQRYGLVTSQTTTGADGSTAQMVNTLTADGSNIQTSTTSVGKAGDTPTARQTLSYEYDGDGQITKRTLKWAPGADPDSDEPGGGPDQIVTTFARTVNLAQATQSITTTVAAGTSAAQPSTAVVDLVSGKAVSDTDAMGRTTTMTYDAIGRRTELDTPDGMTTTVAYTPTQTTVTAPDGRITRTTVDLLGRTVSVTDNVQNGALVTNPTARTLSSYLYSADGTSVTSTDQAGRTTTSVLDAFGRTVSKVGPTGLTNRTAFDDGAAHTTVAEVLPEGSTQPLMGTTTSYDDANRAVHARTSYPTTSNVDPVSAKAFDGLGQPSASTRNDLTVTTDRSGAGGIPASATATPQSTDEFPGDPIKAVTTRSLTGAATSRTLYQGDQVSKAVSVVYDAAGNIVSATDPDGRATTYTYTPDGRPLTKTGPSGSVTTYAYDPTSGLRSGVTVSAPGKSTRTITYTRVPEGQPGAGRVKTVSDGAATITYGYDVDEHRTSVSYPDGTSTSADYNDKGQLVTTTDVTGAVTTYVYNAADGTLKSATQRRGTSVIASAGYTYDAMSRVATTTRGNGTVTTNTYTPENDLASQTTKDATGKVIEAHSYTYDDHHNPATRTDTYSPGGSATATGGTWTTVYSYDAYDRLIGSAVYNGPLSNGAPTGFAVTSTKYTLDLGGNVVATKRTTRLPGVRPITTAATSTNTIDDAGRLTAQKTGSTTANQTFDDEGRVLSALDGVTTTYMSDGSPATMTLPDGTKTTYALWPDGTRRSATTTDPNGGTSTVTYHYGVDGVLLNDSTSDASTGAGTATTGSYLLTAGREARTLLTGTATSGKVSGTPAAAIDTGTGVGYYLHDRHTSVTGLVDGSGAVTATYAYSPYGIPARADGRLVNLGTVDGGRTNPYTYLGAAPRGPSTDVPSGLLSFDDRTYDPAQGRFTSPDPVDAHNRYQGFNTNPIVYLDLSGQMSWTDIGIEAVFAILMLVTAVVTAGAATAAIGAIGAAVEAGVEVTAGAVANATATVLGTVANATGAVSGAVLTANDTIAKTGGNAFLSDSQRDIVNLVNNTATAVAGATGLVQGFTDSAVTAIKAASAESATPDVIQIAKKGYQLDSTVTVGASDQVPIPAGDPTDYGAGNAPPQGLDSWGEPWQLDANDNDEIIANNGNDNNGANPNNVEANPDEIQANPNNNNGQPLLSDQMAQALAGQPNLNEPDQIALNSQPLIPVGVNAGAEVDDVHQQLEANDPMPVNTVDPVMNDNAVPINPHQDPGTYGPVHAFDNTNVILVDGDVQGGLLF